MRPSFLYGRYVGQTKQATQTGTLWHLELRILRPRLYSIAAPRALVESIAVQVSFILLGIFYIMCNAHNIHNIENIHNIRYLLKWDASNVIGYLLILCNISSCLWFSLRLRLPLRSRGRQVLFESAIYCLFIAEALICNLVIYGLLMLYSQLSTVHAYDIPYSIIAIFPLVLIPCLFLFRMGIHFFKHWNRLRRTYLRWALSHAHMMVILICVSVMGLVGTIILFALSAMQVGHYDFVLAFTVFLLILMPLTGIVLLCMLPISILVSTFFTRRLIRRINKLTMATSSVRGGDYSVRIAPDGVDEIARLQSDFNAMAIDLEQTMHDLKEERDNVEKLLHARRELIANVSHELRTPVATVRSYLESMTMGSQVGQQAEALYQDMQVMEQQVIHLQTLINDLFMLSKAEVGHLETRCVPTDLVPVIQRVVDAVAPMAWRSRRIEVLYNVGGSESAPSFPQAIVDGNRLEQILHNLLHNGIRHTAPGGIIVVSLRCEGEWMVLEVNDTGEGIAADELPRIWERFYRARNASNQPGNGTGLGLAIVKELTETMGGSVDVASKPGEGACFSIRLPVAQERRVEHIDQYVYTALVDAGLLPTGARPIEAYEAKDVIVSPFTMPVGNRWYHAIYRSLTGFALSVTAWRALLEMLVVLLILGCLTWLGIGIGYSIAILHFFVVAYCGCSWVCLTFRWRLKRAAQSYTRALLYEMGMFATYSCVLTGSLVLWVYALLYWHPSINDTKLDTTIVVCVVFALLTSCAFFVTRIGLYLLSGWNRLRQTRLRWTFTHMHLMAVVIGSGIISALVIVVQIVRLSFRTFERPFASSLFAVIAVLCLMVFLTFVALIIVLPPSMLASILFSRRITKRIEDLVGATSALRAGNYEIHIQVDGQDEIARLQDDFNMMARALETTMRDLKAERDNVKTLLEARRELIATVSHELRTPVATVRSYLEVTLCSWQDAEPSASFYTDLATMLQQVVRLQTLINDLFTLARAEVGHLEMRCQPTTIFPIMQHVVAASAPIAWRGSRIEVLVDDVTEAASLAMAAIDAQRLEQILHNLVHNAIRHTQPGGIVVLGVCIEGPIVLLQVKDTGEGIAVEELARIWERFYQARTSSPQLSSGSGLGLAIVKELTEAMDGTVVVESMLGEGSCFSLCFPLIPSYLIPTTNYV